MSWNNGEYQPKQKRSDEKKRLILDAALKLFSTHGYHVTTAKAIAAEAGVATGSFYRYFRDKKAVFMGVCLRMEEEIGGSIFHFGRQMRQEKCPEKEILEKLISFSIKGHQQNKEFHREVLAMQILDPDVAEWSREREERLLNGLLDFLQPMQSSYRVKDLEAAAELMYYTIEEISHRAVIFDSRSGEDRLVKNLQEMLVRYLF